MSTCGGCNAPISWRYNDNTGRRAPIDLLVRKGGNIQLKGPQRYHVMDNDERVANPEGHVVHYAVCPEVVNAYPRRDPVKHRETNT